MAYRKDTVETSSEPSTFMNCWWSNEVLSLNNNLAIPFRDFVLISEFSELEGPLPLAVVSNSSYIDLKPYTDKQSANTDNSKLLKTELKKLGLESFDFNTFVLRVVSVDRSTEFEQIDEVFNEQTPMTPSSLFEETPKPYLFSIPDDTQVYFTDSENKFYAFTHHLTLFDINARGYVHPVALSYITRDPNKIVIRFEELMEKFNEVSIRLKKGNYSNFTLDLKCRLLDLEYTQSNLHTDTEPFTPTCTNPIQQKPVLSIQAIQQAVTATKLMIDTLESTTSQIINIISSDSTTNKEIDTLSSEQQSQLASSKYDTHEETSLNVSSAINTRYSVDPPKDYKPKYIDALYPVANFERKLRSLAQLCQEPDDDIEKEDVVTITSPTLNRRHMKRPSITQKTATMIPLVFSMIEPQQPTGNPPMSASSSVTTTSPSTMTFNNVPRLTLTNTIIHDMYSEAIKYIQEMTQYFSKSSVVLDVEEEDNTFVDPISSALTIGRTFMLNVDNPQPRKNIPPSPTFKEEKDDLEQEKTCNDKTLNVSNQTLIDRKSYESFEAMNTIDDDQLLISQINEEDYYPLLFSPSQLWKSKQENPSKTYLLEVLRRYQSLIVDVIFSLLTGRTVLIQGSSDNKSLVQKVVCALSVFVPGQHKHRHQIIDWFEDTRLTEAQIKSIKLVGVDKDNMDPSIHVDSSCVLDIDAKNGSLNSSPVYVEGQWINQLLDRMMLFSSDESYLAYLHTVFMTMSLKAFIYHHLYVSDEFKLDESPPSVSAVNKGYASETNSESSTVSRKWSVRLMNYLKKQDDSEVTDTPTSISKASSVIPSASSSSVRQSEDENYSDENQATVTLQNVMNKNQEEKPRTVVGLFDQHSGESSSAKEKQQSEHSLYTRNERRGSVSTAFSSRRSSDSSSSDDDALSRATFDKFELNFDVDNLHDFGINNNSGDSSSDDEDYKANSSSNVSRPSMRKGKHRFRNIADIGPDGVSYIEREGRRYLQEKLKVYGDDQTIVVYLATCVL